MTIEEHGNTVVVANTTAAIFDFVSSINNQFGIPERHLIVNLTENNELPVKEAKLFIPLVKKYRKGRKSFVLVVPNADFSKYPEVLVVVPSVIEAFDIIEMEEIERDLGL